MRMLFNFKTSKLSDSVAQALGFVSGVPRAAAIIIIVFISGFFTEVTSNLSTATIFFPVLDSVVGEILTYFYKINLEFEIHIYFLAKIMHIRTNLFSDT
jgi:Na+/H+ antiporter NhaD/arsenite permease-like protein